MKEHEREMALDSCSTPVFIIYNENHTGHYFAIHQVTMWAKCPKRSQDICGCVTKSRLVEPVPMVSLILESRKDIELLPLLQVKVKYGNSQ